MRERGYLGPFSYGLEHGLPCDVLFGVLFCLVGVAARSARAGAVLCAFCPLVAGMHICGALSSYRGGRRDLPCYDI